jgi:hypothetical protein
VPNGKYKVLVVFPLAKDVIVGRFINATFEGTKVVFYAK